MSSAPSTLAARLQHVTRRFGGVEAVRDVSLDIAHGERRVILGPNGAGKSTLFGMIAGDIQPTQGTITLFGQDVTRLNTQYRARHGVTRTYQMTHLFGSLTTRENLFLAVRGIKPGHMSVRLPRLSDQDMEQAEQVAARIGLRGALDKKVATLSHGEQRQLELGMALAGNPRMIILDEPAAGLSQAERGRLTRLLLDLDSSITVLLIEHDMDVALLIAQYVTVMHNGRVIVNGTPDEIRTSRVVNELYLGEQHA